jgi:hypothetical protein
MHVRKRCATVGLVVIGAALCVLLPGARSDGEHWPIGDMIVQIRASAALISPDSIDITSQQQHCYSCELCPLWPLNLARRHPRRRGVPHGGLPPPCKPQRHHCVRLRRADLRLRLLCQLRWGEGGVARAVQRQRAAGLCRHTSRCSWGGRPQPAA